MSAYTDLSDPKTLADLITKRARLEKLQKRTEEELCAVINGLKVAGVLPPGRPRMMPIATTEQARAAHAAYARGDRDDATVLGERQYQRDRKRRTRSAA